MDIFETRVLAGIVRDLISVPPMFLLKFFPGRIETDAEKVSIDVEIGKRRMAPFVSPRVAGKIVEGRRVETATFRPAYIKDKRAPDLKKPVKRMVGERIGGEMTAGERMQANLVFEMEDQVNMLNRRLVWMAAQALVTGTVPVVGEGIPPCIVDFQRDPGLTVVLSGSAQWGQAGVSPSQSCDDMALKILELSGAVVTDIIFTRSSWGCFTADQKIRDAIYFPRAGDSNVNLGGGVKAGAMSKGIWGNYQLWLYNDWAVDPLTDVSAPMIPDGGVVFASDDLQGNVTFGAIMDPDFEYGPMAYAPKSWTEKDPAQRWLMLQSSPIVIPERVNACAYLQACAAGTPAPNGVNL